MLKILLIIIWYVYLNKNNKYRENCNLGDRTQWAIIQAICQAQRIRLFADIKNIGKSIIKIPSIDY